MIHVLKCDAAYFERVLDGTKTFEVRFNDRGFQRGDTVHLREVDASGVLTGREASYHIGFVFSGDQRFGYPALNDGYVVFSLLTAPWSTEP